MCRSCRVNAMYIKTKEFIFCCWWRVCVCVCVTSFNYWGLVKIKLTTCGNLNCWSRIKRASFSSSKACTLYVSLCMNWSRSICLNAFEVWPVHTHTQTHHSSNLIRKYFSLFLFIYLISFIQLHNNFQIVNVVLLLIACDVMHSNPLLLVMGTYFHSHIGIYEIK